MPNSLPKVETQYLTREGDVLDKICWNYYGRTKGTVEATLLRNRTTLSFYRSLLPAGVLLVLPVVSLPDSGIKLWNYRAEVLFTPTSAQSSGDSLLAVQDALATYRLNKQVV